jgi:hypothetical protein
LLLWGLLLSGWEAASKRISIQFFSFKKLDSGEYIAQYGFHDSKQLFGSLFWGQCSELGLAALA